MTVQYKETLNLPTTSFPMKADLAKKEPSYLSYWTSHSIYDQIRAARKGKPLFFLHDGPPYANGHLHCGHALNKILKDFIVKSKTMSGFDAPFIPGWDCHGLPIELNVEKKIGKAGVKVTPSAFRTACRLYAQEQVHIQREEFQRLGVLGEWMNPYQTMDYHYEADIIRSFGTILKNGHVHQGFKPVYWCLDCGSALAEAEVDYDEKTSYSIDVAFYLHDHTFVDSTVIVPIWTTTPWTLPANEAVAVHAELSYALVLADGVYFLIAESLVESTMQRYGHTSYQIIKHVFGRALAGHFVAHPFIDRNVPIVCADHVTTEAGTGCVHTAPAHGPEDYQVGVIYDLPRHNPVLSNGCYDDTVPQFSGVFVRKADPLVVACLKEKGALLAESRVHHSYPHCWRHKTPVIFRATPQWFISMEQEHLRAQLVQAIEGVQWLPEWGKARILSMVKDRPDWCISRQRAWGTPIPLFLHRETQTLHPDTFALIESVAQRVEVEGIEAWFSSTAEDWIGEDAAYYTKSTDTLDVWFDSGVSHACVVAKKYPNIPRSDLYFEGSDQHRGWFNSSLTTAVAMHHQAPYKTVLTHGYTVDAQGKKLSKSKGNYVALDQLIEQYGADILRLWVASSDYRYEVSISNEIIKRVSEAYRRIRNTARFLLANLFDFDPAVDQVPVSEWVALDRFIVQQAQTLQEEMIQAYDDYQFHVIYQKIHHFCVIDLGSFYLDVIKDRQYTLPKGSIARRSCQTAMYHLLQAFVRWIAPILSFTAEEIWQYTPGFADRSIFLESWYQAWPVVSIDPLFRWDRLMGLRNEVNKAIEGARQQGVVGSSLEASVRIYVPAEDYTLLSLLGNELKFLLIVSHVEICSATTLAVEVQLCKENKCERCWHRCASVGQNEQHSTLCHRCIDHITTGSVARCFV